MRFIVDAQLPPALAGWLEATGMEATSARDAGLRDADDRTIWEWALAREAAIVTKDQDFAIRRSASVRGPAIVWLRMGNTVNSHLLARFAEAWPAIETHLRDGRPVIEVR